MIHTNARQSKITKKNSSFTHIVQGRDVVPPERITAGVHVRYFRNSKCRSSVYASIFNIYVATSKGKKILPD
jgi:hypothetical protein